MEIAVKVVEDANFFFSTEQLPLLVGSRLNLETEERGTTVKVENRLQERKTVRKLSGGLNNFDELCGPLFRNYL